MKKEFISYEQALELKKLGFDEPCFCYWYTQQGSFPSIRGKDIQFNGWKNYPDSNIVAPLYQQAFRWFREKYDFVGTVLGDGFNGKLKGYYYSITEEGWINYYESIDDMKWYDTYEEAELACLNKLIEIVKDETHKT